MRDLFYHLLSLVICKMIGAKNYGDSGLPRLLYQSASDKQKKKISGIKSCWESRGQETVSRVQDGLLTDGRHFLVEQIRLLIRHRLICFLSFIPFVASWADYGLRQSNKENANVFSWWHSMVFVGNYFFKTNVIDVIIKQSSRLVTSKTFGWEFMSYQWGRPKLSQHTYASHSFWIPTALQRIAISHWSKDFLTNKR